MNKIGTGWILINLTLLSFTDCGSRQLTDWQNNSKLVKTECEENILYIFPNPAFRECFKKNLKSDFDIHLVNLNGYSLFEIQKSYLLMMDYYNAVLESAKKDMEDSSNNRLKITLLGIFTTTAATVLATASPANAAAVAGLGTISTGIITYQGVISEEGGSREALYRVYLKLLEKQESLKLEFGKRFLIASITPPNTLDKNDPFNAENYTKPDNLTYIENYAYLKLVIYELFIFAYKTPSLSTEKEIEKIKEGITTAKKEIAKTYEELDVKNRKVSNENEKKLNKENADKQIKSIIDNLL